MVFFLVMLVVIFMTTLLVALEGFVSTLIVRFIAAMIKVFEIDRTIK